MELRAEGDIERPVSEVFHFYADEHVQNHPRWDPDVKLEAAEGGPLGVGSVIKRHITRMGGDVHGEMTVTEFDRDEAFAVEIRDGPMTMQARVTFAALDAGQTRITIALDAPGIEDPDVGKVVEGLMQRSVDNIRSLLEST